MSRNSILFSVLLLFVFGKYSFSLEIDTHAIISQESAQRSVLYSTDGVLNDIGIDYNSYYIRVDDNDERYEIFEAVGLGAEFEDDSPRPLNHFYDPVNDKALIGNWVAFKSPDWALEDISEVPDQEYSLRHAKKYYYDALISSDKEERENNFGRLFRSLGQVIHHVQDMSQPQHVRNDAHCDHTCKYLEKFGVYEPSIYEKHTNNNIDIVKQFYSGYQPPVFNKARNYWTTSSGKGIADFTNRNFVTEETNFSEDKAGNFVVTEYQQPAPLNKSEWVRIEEALPELAKQGITGDMLFVSTLVDDKQIDSAPVENKQASTFSLLDQDVVDNNACVEYVLNLDDNNQKTYTYETCRLFTYNHLNVEATYPFLVPRAVAYSTGLINYFFRGRVDIVDIEKSISDSGETVYTLKVKNISSNDFDFNDGEFEIYYDADDGTRNEIALISGKDVTELQNSAETTIEFSLPSDIDSGKENPFVLVYRGKIGEETGIAGKVFSVEADTPLLAWMQNWDTNDVTLWRSADNGASWDIVIPAFSFSSPWLSEFVSIGPGHALALIGGYYESRIYKTTDNGKTWILIEKFLGGNKTMGSSYEYSDLIRLNNSVPVGYDAEARKVRLMSFDRQYLSEYQSVSEYSVLPVYSADGGESWGTGGSDPTRKNTIGLTRLDNYKVVSDTTVLAVGDIFDRSCDTCDPEFHRPAYFISNDAGSSWSLNKTDVSDTLVLDKDYATFPDIGRLISREWKDWTTIPLFHLSDDAGITWDKAIQFNPKSDVWPYAWPWYTVYLGKGTMAAYIHDDLTLPSGNGIPYYEGIVVSTNQGINWKETGFRSNVTGQSPGWPEPAPVWSSVMLDLGVVTRNPDKVRYVH